MLFNSYEFLFLFLPVTLAGYFLLGRTEKSGLANVWVIFASLFFYAYWDWHFLPVLLVSMAGNYFLAGRIQTAFAAGREPACRRWFWLGLAFDLGMLGYYKYTGFVARNLDRLGAGIPMPDIVLPLGISFFTITQLLYLYDSYKGVARDHDPVRYALFVSFFPHLLAGPILYHRQMMHQFADEKLRRFGWENVARGAVLFTIGLAKKCLIADALAVYVNDGWAHLGELSLFTGWLVAISYMLQLYFDFSGYSDMAVGLARMMNLTIPVNFKAPYRAASLIAFWQRWHISLTNAITACVYYPLVQALGRRTLARSIFAASVTLFLVGIWHGAGVTFGIFAALNAVGLAVNHVWRAKGGHMPKACAHVLLLLFVLTFLVFFRAPSVYDACQMLTILGGAQGVLWPAKVTALASHVGLVLAPGNVPGALLPKAIFVLAILLVAFAPPSQDLVKRLQPDTRAFRLAPLALGLLLAACVLQFGAVTQFLYFQF